MADVRANGARVDDAASDAAFPHVASGVLGQDER
jgi:hypothetical protein